jgi:hypothetical protein
MHFQTWQDKAGNAPPLANVVDPVTGVKVTFPDLNVPPFGGEDFQTNLIMPEPTFFLSKKFPACSIIRPTATKGAAAAALKALTGDGLFIGQSPQFFAFLGDLAEDADEARRFFQYRSVLQPSPPWSGKHVDCLIFPGEVFMA